MDPQNTPLPPPDQNPGTSPSQGSEVPASTPVAPDFSSGSQPIPPPDLAPPTPEPAPPTFEDQTPDPALPPVPPAGMPPESAVPLGGSPPIYGALPPPPVQGETPPLSAPGAVGMEIHPDERNMAMFCHLTALAGYIILIPGGNLVIPLVLWLMYRDKMPFVAAEGREAVNFGISVLIYATVAGLLSFFCIGIPLLIALVIFHVVVVIMASLAASKGLPYRYPLCIRLVS